MTDQQHPIIPPPELLQQWATEYWGNPGESIGNGEKCIAIQAAQWGADQELEACCEWLGTTQWCEPDGKCLSDLRSTRRPKPPSLKEQAQVGLDRLVALISTKGALAMAEPIRRALETLDD